MDIKKKSHILVFALFLVFILLNLSIYSNMHIHISEGGFFFIHSHPYDRTENNHSPIAAHPHARIDLLALALSFLIEFTIIFAGFLLFSSNVTSYLFNAIEKIETKSSFLNLPSMRAPPASMSSL
ncbi:MAG: hypothetical protein V2J62_07755 [candidate division KSB1 bacterium]|jgi:hypothetical protein|nr:hypothetical protein [candidate division KSB1 bacterium]